MVGLVSRQKKRRQTKLASLAAETITRSTDYLVNKIIPHIYLTIKPQKRQKSGSDVPLSWLTPAPVTLRAATRRAEEKRGMRPEGMGAAIYAVLNRV